jgi:hypothetical protein
VSPSRATSPQVQLRPSRGPHSLIDVLLCTCGTQAEPVEKGTFCEPELDQEPQLGPSVL